MIIRIFVVNKSLNGKCSRLWENEEILDLRVLENWK